MRGTAVMGDEERLLFANEAFYVAFASADADAMRDLWSTERPVSIIHPGADIVFGLEDVLQSWSQILDAPASFDIEMRRPTARLYGDTGIVACYEKVGAHSLIATNVFVRTRDAWLLVHHQSGPSPVLPQRDEGESRPVH